MVHDIRAAVSERYSVELVEMDRTQFEEFVSQEATRLEALIAQVQSQTELSVIADWRTANGGADPDTLTLTGLYGQARLAAEETVLASQVWEGYRSPEDTESPAETVNQEWLSGMEQWRRGWPVEATPEMVALAETLWPGQTPKFLVWGEQLLAARAVDGLPLPEHPRHRLVGELTAQVNAAVADQARADAARRAQR